MHIGPSTFDLTKLVEDVFDTIRHGTSVKMGRYSMAKCRCLYGFLIDMVRVQVYACVDSNSDVASLPHFSFSPPPLSPPPFFFFLSSSSV